MFVMKRMSFNIIFTASYRDMILFNFFVVILRPRKTYYIYYV
ncbi:hypothetical protein Premu_1250 [Hallella multisaccharivorax DSM 17128]|uniref:Uncharacterized protein n=1 Tax=Hallella multisaccharivorax DSM 17128 TaxID=688246 RepID=F8N9N7_9BACT|nr:hypothetical protein Premu_1250 [Hallella multisaccharivorax DSM 17128]